jgi:hypothetical protein
MKVKLIVSSLMALGVLSQSPLAFGAAKDLNSATAPADADYPKVGGNLGNQNYSGLTQINKHNLKNLGAAWKLDVSAAPTTKPVAAPGTTTTGQQTSPLVIDGVIYSDTPVGGVIAVDGKTGAVKWKWTPSTAANGFGPSGTRRGVSVGDGKVFTLASGNRVVALNKDTGDIVWVVQPTGAGGASLGNVAKVGTVYFDGMVYIGTNDAGRNAGLAVRSSDGALQWYFFGAADTGFVVTDVNGVTYNAPGEWQQLRAHGRGRALDAPGGRSGAQPGVLDVRQYSQLRIIAGRQRTSRHQPLRKLDGGDRCEDGRLQVALPVAAPWLSRHGQHPAAVGGRGRRRWRHQEGDLLRQQGLGNVHSRPYHRQGNPQCRRTSGAPGLAAEG